MFTFEGRVRYSEVDQEGFLRPTAVVDYLQDCTCFHSESLGIGWRELGVQGISWVLTFWQIVIEEYPQFNEWISIGTAPWGFNQMMGMRNFAIQDEFGNYKVKANSLWVLMDLKKGHPIKIMKELAEQYPCEEKLEMDYCDRKIHLPKEMKKREPIKVKYTHIDTNHHVNNAAYMKMAMEVIGENIRPREIRIEYKNQAKMGNVIYPRVGEMDDFQIVSLENEQGKAYAVVALRM
ncbi:MAG: acyl-[acyl-carrier-protein] thioesterase [Lachnospiraceae bacterium]